MELGDVFPALKAIQFNGTMCILGSLAVRDVLRRLGFEAEVKSVALRIQATAFDADVPMHSLGVGMNKLWNDPYKGKDWDGHLVVATKDWIIDPTFYAMRRKAWDWIDDVAIVPRDQGNLDILDTDSGVRLPIIAKMIETGDYNYKFQALWASYSANKGWRGSPDFRDHNRRKILADAILEGFNANGLLPDEKVPEK